MNKDRIIKYIEEKEIPLIETSGNKNVGLILDTETTGLEKDSKIIELSILAFEFDDKTFQITKILGKYTSFNEVSEIPENITKLTGISLDDVRGHKIDWSIVYKLFKKADIVIAHNAAFDRKIMESNFPSLKELDVIWLCSA